MTTVTTIEPGLSYAALLEHYQPHPIRNDEDEEPVRELINALLDVPSRTPDEEAFLGLLGDIMFSWEEGRYEPGELDPLEMIEALLESHGLHQQDLVGPVFPTKGIASEVLHGKRRLTYDFVQRLAAFFHVSPALFFPAMPE